MTRLQKKCLFAAAGTHLLVVVVLLCSGWIKPATTVDNTPVLTLVNLTDAQTTGSKSEPTPPPQPVVEPPQPTPPTPEPPKPIITPVQQVKPPEPVQPPEEVKPVEHAEIAIPKPPKKQHEVKVNLTPVVRDSKKVADDTKAAEAAAIAKANAEAKKRDQARKAFQSAMSNIKSKSSSSTTVSMPEGDNSVSFANYASVVKSIYERAWVLPDDTTSDDADVMVSVTISNDGRVMDAHIIDASGDSKVDGSIRRTLDRVTFIAPFPEGAKEKERTFKIKFNLKAKRMLG